MKNFFKAGAAPAIAAVVALLTHSFVSTGCNAESADKEALALKLPAPTLKGTPEDLPAGPNIEALPDKPRPAVMAPKGVKNVAVGCSGVNRSQLVLVREALKPAAHPDEDETLYLIAGEATLTLAGKEQALTPGWFSLIPRGSTYGLVKKGRNPAIFLSIVAGPACNSAETTR